MSNIYHVPRLMLEQQFHSLLADKLQLRPLVHQRQQQQSSEAARSISTPTQRGEEVPLNELKAEWLGMAERIDQASDVAVICLVRPSASCQCLICHCTLICLALLTLIYVA